MKKDAGIPVNHNAEMYINYAEPMNYPHMTSDEVFTKQGLDKVKGKIVVVGLDAAGLRYLKYTPHGLTTDQMITAQGLDTTLTGKYLFRLAQADTYEIVFMAFLLLLLILVLPRTSVLLAVPLLIFIEGGVAYGAFDGIRQQRVLDRSIFHNAVRVFNLVSFCVQQLRDTEQIETTDQETV